MVQFHWETGHSGHVNSISEDKVLLVCEHACPVCHTVLNHVHLRTPLEEIPGIKSKNIHVVSSPQLTNAFDI